MTLCDRNSHHGFDVESFGCDMVAAKAKKINKELSAWMDGLRLYFALHKDTVKQARVADAIGITSTYLSMIVNKKKIPSRDVVDKINDVIGLENIVGNIKSENEHEPADDVKIRKALSEHKSLNAALELQLSSVMSKYTELHNRYFELLQDHEKVKIQLEKMHSRAATMPTPADDSSHAELVTYFQQKKLAKQINWDLIKLEKADAHSLIKIHRFIKQELHKKGIEAGAEELQLDIPKQREA